MSLRPLLLTLLLIPMAAWADLRGLDLYARGEFAKALPLLEEEAENPARSDKERARARSYAAAAMYSLGRMEEAREQLELLARQYPEQRVDPKRFPPDFVALADLARKTVETERFREEARAQEAEQERLAAEAERRRRELEALQQVPEPVETQAVSSFRVRPELVGFGDFKDGTALGMAVGVTVGRGPLEGTVRALIGNPHIGWEAEAGVVFGSWAFQPRVSVRGILMPGIEVPDTRNPGAVQSAVRSGLAGAVGGRLALSPRVTALMDVGYGWLFGMPAQYNKHVVMASAGLGFNLF
ncbi:hypothetical protein [Archangium sp.]|uniref:hypothetical protein n=1 Tax=Archangium sp. TaxID=1872627 RepID=UPI00286C4DC9|nr:hypothetical protein [Archangium sp.]